MPPRKKAAASAKSPSPPSKTKRAPSPSSSPANKKSRTSTGTPAAPSSLELLSLALNCVTPATLRNVLALTATPSTASTPVILSSCTSLTEHAISNLLPTTLCVLELLLGHLNDLSPPTSITSTPTPNAAALAIASLLPLLLSPLTTLLTCDPVTLEATCTTHPGLNDTVACLQGAAVHIASRCLQILAPVAANANANADADANANAKPRMPSLKTSLLNALNCLENLTVHTVAIKGGAERTPMVISLNECFKTASASSSSSSPSSATPSCTLLASSDWTALLSTSNFLPSFNKTPLSTLLASLFTKKGPLPATLTSLAASLPSLPSLPLLTHSPRTPLSLANTTHPRTPTHSPLRAWPTHTLLHTLIPPLPILLLLVPLPLLTTPTSPALTHPETTAFAARCADVLTSAADLATRYGSITAPASLSR